MFCFFGSFVRRGMVVRKRKGIEVGGKIWGDMSKCWVFGVEFLVGVGWGVERIFRETKLLFVISF